jgi:hypothetical protein
VAKKKSPRISPGVYRVGKEERNISMLSGGCLWLYEIYKGSYAKK